MIIRDTSAFLSMCIIAYCTKGKQNDFCNSPLKHILDIVMNNLLFRKSYGRCPCYLPAKVFGAYQLYS